MPSPLQLIRSPLLSSSTQSRLLDALPDALMVIDSKGRLAFANKAAQRLLGCEPGMPLVRLEPCLGAAALQWLQRGMKQAGREPCEDPPAVHLLDGRRARLDLLPIDGGSWALQARPESPAVGALAHSTEAAQPSLRTKAGPEMLGVFRDSPFPATLQDENYRLVGVNQAYAEFCGLSMAELIGRDPLDFAPEEERPIYRAQRRVLRDALDDAGAPALAERRLVNAAGHERWYRIACRVLSSDGGEPLLLSVMQDCTGEKLARDAVERSVHELDQWFELSTSGMVLFDGTGLVVRSNAAFESLVGHVPVALGDADIDLQQLLGWEGNAPHARLQPGAPALECHGTLTLPDGRTQRLRALVRGFESVLGQRRFMAVVEDRNVEEERDLAQLEIGALMDTAGVGLATFEESRGWIRRVMPSFSRGRQKVDADVAALQSITREMVEPASMPEYDRLQRALKRGERAEVRYAVRHPELGARWLLTRVEPGRLSSGQRATSVITLDVTEQKQAQVRNEQLLGELTTILESTSAGMAYFRGDTIVRCNRRFEELLDLAGGVAAGATLAELFRRQPLMQPLIEQSQQSLESGRTFETEFAVPRRDGSLRWFALSVRRVKGVEVAFEAIAVLTDITRLKAQQVELERLLRDRELMFSLSEVGIAYLREGRIERANGALAELTGYGTAELMHLEHAQLFEDRAAYLGFIERDEPRLLRQGRSQGERRLRRRDGSLIWVQVSKRQVDESDPRAGLICAYVNVDDRYRAQQTLEQQAARTRAILDSVLVGIVTVGRNGIEWLNRSARRMFAGDLPDFVGEPIATVATPDPDHPLRRTDYLDDLSDGQSKAFECQLRARDGREFWVVGNAVVTGHDVETRQVTFALLDIERRRQAEMSIAQTQASLQLIIDTAPLAISLLDARTLRVLRHNQIAAAFAGCASGDMVARTPHEFLDNEASQAMQADMLAALASGEVTRREYRRLVDGQTRIWDARYVPLATEPGQPSDQMLLVASDVTEQRVAYEARLQEAIAQREMLVKEVHHRIKNNLQGVAGLLQQIAMRRPEVRAVINEAVGQVQAIAQVYGLQVGASGPLRLRGLIESIAGSVSRMFGRAIAMQVEGENAQAWTLPEAESIPIALTVNELLTNAVKHAEGGGEVLCVLRCLEAEVCIVIVNPGQLPQGFSLSKIHGGVSGLGLVRALLPRRHATLTLDQEDGRVIANVTLVPPGVTRALAA